MPESRQPEGPLVQSDRYTPMSGLAVTAFGVSVVAVLLILIISVVARMGGKPAYQPFLLLPAVIGFALAVVALWSVRHAQGARTGLGFAKAALWLSGLGGGCFAVYMVTTELTIRAQAKDFILQWFDKIKDSPLEASFLWTLPAEQRQRIADADTEGIQARFGQLMLPYRNHKIVRLLRDAGKDVEIQSRGVHSWDSTSSGFMVQQIFDIRTREGKFQCLIGALGQDRPSLNGRGWEILLNRSDVKEWTTTEYGRLLIDAQLESYQFIRAWLEKINRQQFHDAFLETLPPAERAKFQADSDATDFQMLKKGSFIRIDGEQGNTDEREKYASSALRAGQINTNPGTPATPVGRPYVDFTNGRVRVSHMIEVNREMAKPVVASLVVEVISDRLSQRIKELMAMDWKQLPFLPAPDPDKLDSAQAMDRYTERQFQILMIDVHPKAPRLTPQPPQGP